MVKPLIVAAVLLATVSVASAEPSPRVKTAMGLRDAFDTCVRNAFHLEDTRPELVERAFAACATEERAFLAATSFAVYFPGGPVPAEGAQLHARAIVEGYKANLKQDLLRRAGMAKRALGRE